MRNEKLGEMKENNYDKYILIYDELLKTYVTRLCIGIILIICYQTEGIFRTTKILNR